MNKKVWMFSQRISQGRWGTGLTQCCLLHGWKAKPEQSVTTKANSFFTRTLVGVRRRLKLLMMEKLQPRNSSRPFFSRLSRILPTLPEPTSGRGQCCLAGDLSSSSTAVVKGTGLHWQGRVKFPLQCYLTAPVVFFSTETKLSPLQNEMCYPKSSPSFGKNLVSPLKSKVRCWYNSCSRFLWFCDDFP